MFGRVHIIGTGRAGSAVAARLRERGIAVTTGRLPDPDAELVVMAVPDSAIGEVAAAIPVGPWVAHLSGATRLTALDPHRLRFSVHPLQTLSLERGAEQLDGAWGAIGAESDEARRPAQWLAEHLGLRWFQVAEADRAVYHAGAVIAGNFLVTIYRAAAQLLEESAAPPEALVPLMTRTIENGFVLTGPFARGDTATIEAHLRALQQRAPELLPLYRALAKATRP